METAVVILSLVVMVVAIVLILRSQKPQHRLMSKKDHEARKAAEELEALRRMNDHYKRIT
jgi:uncharacterized membrane protein